MLEHARRAVQGWVAEGWLKQQRDAFGELASTFPRLALNWSFFRPPEDQPERLAQGEGFWYKGPTGSQSGLDLAGIAALVRQDPAARHRVFGRGWSAWRDAAEIPELQALLQADAPRSSAPAAGESYHYACDGERLGQRGAAEIAEAFAARRGADHRVWQKAFGRTWKPVQEVPELMALVPPEIEEPPPLPDDEPPPLPDDEPPPLT
jgi:hypothetical protein